MREIKPDPLDHRSNFPAYGAHKSHSSLFKKHEFTSLLSLALCLAHTSSLCAQQSESAILTLHESDTLTIQGHFQTGLNAVAEENLFWNLAEQATNNTDFDPDTAWLESFLEAGVSFTNKIDSGHTLFGKISTVASYTAGTDAFDASDTGRITLEEMYLAQRFKLTNNWELEVSIGPRILHLGTGMLIYNGSGDGFERGALKFGPREAWQQAGIFKLSRNKLAATAFYLEPNEMTSNDSHNSIGGLDIRWDGDQGGFAGLSYLRVIDSQSPYPQAASGGDGPPDIIPNARSGINTLNFYGKTDPLDGVIDNLTLGLDLAYQWGSKADLHAWGGRVKAEYTLKDVPYQPVLSYSYQMFTGDDPNTNRLERFDPLYYNGSPSSWATGSKSAMVFINSNIQAHNLSLRLTPSPRDIVTLRYSHIRAHELRSPVQFGQATRLDLSNGLSTVVSGVTDAHLSDDFFIEYTHILNPNIFLTGGFSISIPGDGIKKAAGGDAPDWTGAFINVVINY